MGRTYLYGIIRSAENSGIGINGVDRVSPVRIVASDGLGCAVSDYKGPEFETLSREQLVRSLLTHQQVVEHIMQDRTVLPVKFGTFLDEDQDALDLLSQGHSKFASALASIHDKIEIEVAATWDTNEVLGKMGNEDDVVHARAAIARKGQPTLEDRIELGQIVKACMDRHRSRHREQMVSLLKPLSVDVAFNALVSDAMVMNVAFLVGRTRQHEFDMCVKELDTLFQGEINFRVIGPLPPYSFSTVEIASIDAEQVKEARHILNLGEAMSEAEVRRAYRRMAAEDQRNPGAQGGPAAGQFARLKWASELLLRCCRAWEESHQGRQRDTQPGQHINQLFDIAIKRVRSEEIEPTRFGQVAMASGVR